MRDELFIEVGIPQNSILLISVFPMVLFTIRFSTYEKERRRKFTKNRIEIQYFSVSGKWLRKQICNRAKD